MAALAAANRTDADLERIGGCMEAVREAADDPQAYSDAMNGLVLAIATATGNRIFPMLVHWHTRVQSDLDDLLLAVRKPGAGHLQGIELLVQLITNQDVPGIANILGQFHAWAIPQLLGVAAERNLRHGEPT